MIVNFDALNAKKIPLSQEKIRKRIEAARIRPDTLTTLSDYNFDDEDIFKLIEYSDPDCDNFLSIVASILSSYDFQRIALAIWKEEEKKWEKRPKPINYDIGENPIIGSVYEKNQKHDEEYEDSEDSEMKLKNLLEQVDLLKQIILNSIKEETNYNIIKGYFKDYVKRKFDLMTNLDFPKGLRSNEWNLSETISVTSEEINEAIKDPFTNEEVENMLAVVDTCVVDDYFREKSTVGDKSISQRTDFMEGVLWLLRSDKWFDKSNILKSVNLITPNQFTKELERKKNYSEALISLVQNIAYRRKTIIEKWLPEETLDLWLSFADSDHKISYLRQIKEFLLKNEELGVAKISDAVNHFSEIFDRYNDPLIKNLTPFFILNYIIINDNWDQISNDVNKFLNNKDKTLSECFPNVDFFWSEDEKMGKDDEKKKKVNEKMRKVLQIVLREKKDESRSGKHDKREKKTQPKIKPNSGMQGWINDDPDDRHDKLLRLKKDFEKK